MLQRKYKQLDNNCFVTKVNFTSGFTFPCLTRDKSSFANLVPRYFSLVNLDMRKRPLHVYTKMEQAINNNIFIKLLITFYSLHRFGKLRSNPTSLSQCFRHWRTAREISASVACSFDFSVLTVIKTQSRASRLCEDLVVASEIIA